MRKRSLLALTAGLVTAVLLALGAVVVVAAPDTDLPWSVFGAGGGTSSSTNYDLGSTAGQSAIGPAQSTNYALGAGYWHGVACSADSDADTWTNCQELYITTGPQNPCTLNGWPPDPRPLPGGNAIVQIDDVVFAASAFGSTTTPRAEIANQNGVVQIDDVVEFASRFGDTC